MLQAVNGEELIEVKYRSSTDFGIGGLSIGNWVEYVKCCAVLLVIANIQSYSNQD